VPFDIEALIAWLKSVFGGQVEIEEVASAS
jgi:hypothetical protein